ncbi:4'-phosphopantetheinyl transferase superfamily protein [Flavivirga jejuensis]|uniref:4'-phosphopantetheinyl transferase superfamily protein n=2 Tax=Flavivirga jejuensis TaxID=870487 RepID=A0ABT8WVE5_9FLAO|nr:4'-phosphopantetheinyl transferase superfamily protein [Flavivirga jejuensis]
MMRENDIHIVAVAFVQSKLDEVFLHVEKLHHEEKKRYYMLIHDRRKISYLLGRLAAKQALMSLTKVAIENSIWIDSGIFGFPVVRCKAMQNKQVSISHSNIMGISIAFEENHPMGIDLEKISTNQENVILNYITDEEKVLLKNINMNTIAGYTVIWSIKESLSKVIKTGMMLDFSLLTISSITLENSTFECSFHHFGQYKAIAHINDNYAISIALPRKTKANFNEVWGMFASLSHE